MSSATQSWTFASESLVWSLPGSAHQSLKLILLIELYQESFNIDVISFLVNMGKSVIFQTASLVKAENILESLLLEACWLWSYNKITLKKYIVYYMRWINFYSDGNEVLEGTRVSFGTWEEVICWSGLFIVYQAEHWREDTHTHIPCWVCVWKTARVMHCSWNLGMSPKAASQLKRLHLWFVLCWVNASWEREQEGCQSVSVLQGCLWMVVFPDSWEFPFQG